MAASAARSAALAAVLLLLGEVARSRSVGRSERSAPAEGTGGGREKKAPTIAILDSQSVKSAYHRGVRGRDGGKKIMGRKRHLAVDSLGLVLQVAVSQANLQDRAGARLVAPALLRRHRRLRVFYVDGGYHSAPLVAELRAVAPKRDVRWEVVRRNKQTKGFAVEPRRWLVERTFGWLSHWRRLAKDYEVRTDSSEAMIYLAAIKIMLQRLTR